VHQHASRLPVIVFIHGGDFQRGSGSQLDASVLAAFGNVVVVTVNYRLGLLGNLSLSLSLSLLYWLCCPRNDRPLVWCWLDFH
jgi:carboxylesterase type B